MSGGAFNYLCHREPDELLVHQQDIRDMAEFLRSVRAIDAQVETLAMLSLIEKTEERLNAYLDRLPPVWKAAEWWQSGDWSKEQFEEALKEYRDK
jgi:hypothetical protein